jgi:hypothetical protein
MKKFIFITSLFLVSGILLYLIMRGGEGIDGSRGPKPEDSNTLVLMVDSVKIADWKNNEQFRRVKSVILLSESNSKINGAEKERLLTSLNINYAFSLNKKYNSIKLNFTSFPSALYSEMQAFQSKEQNLKTGVSELNAYLNLERMEGSVNQYLNRRYSAADWNNFKNSISNLNLGSLASNSKVISMRSNYNAKLNQFKNDLEYVTKLIDKAENGASFREYQEITDYKNDPSVIKYSYYRNWFNNPSNAKYLE